MNEEPVVIDSNPIPDSWARDIFLLSRRGKSTLALLVAPYLIQRAFKNGSTFVQVGAEGSPQAEVSCSEDVLPNNSIMVWVDETHSWRPPSKVPEELLQRPKAEKPKPERPWVEMKRRNECRIRKRK